MKDPQRLLPQRLLSELDRAEGSDAFARSLLQAGRDIEAPANAKAEVWANLESALGVAAGAASVGQAASTTAKVTTSSAAAGSKAGLLAAIGGVVTVAAGAVVLVSAFGTTEPAPVAIGGRTAGSSVVAVPQSVFPGSGDAQPRAVEDAAPRAALAETPNQASTAPVAPMDSSSVAPKTNKSSGRVAQATSSIPQSGSGLRGAPRSLAASEPNRISLAASAAPSDGDQDSSEQDNRARAVKLVARAHSELASGQPAKALATLAELDRDMPTGPMIQERQVLAIEALAQSGQRAEAKRRARAFIAANPNSTLVNRLSPYID